MGCLGGISACNNNTNTEKPIPKQEEKKQTAPKETPLSYDTLSENMILEGGVMRFTEEACIVSPLLTEEIESGGSVASQATPGFEDEERNVTVRYQQDCQFQLAIIDSISGEVEMTTSNKEAIKKETQVFVYGEYQDATHILATKIVIIRFDLAGYTQ